MRVGKCVGQLHREPQGEAERKGLGNERAERPALDVLHDGDQLVAGIDQFEQRDDGGMIQHRRCARLREQLRACIRHRRSVRRRQKLERNLSAESFGFGEIDDAHAALAQFAQYAVVGDVLTNGHASVGRRVVGTGRMCWSAAPEAIEALRGCVVLLQHLSGALEQMRIVGESAVEHSRAVGGRRVRGRFEHRLQLLPLILVQIEHASNPSEASPQTGE